MSTADYERGFEQGESAAELIDPYPKPVNDFQRGVNAGIKSAQRLFYLAIDAYENGEAP